VHRFVSQVRGKQRLGFELNLTCEFKGSVDAVEVTTNMKFRRLSLLALIPGKLC
jgi:hypothetical protein